MTGFSLHVSASGRVSLASKDSGEKSLCPLSHLHATKAYFSVRDTNSTASPCRLDRDLRPVCRVSCGDYESY